MWVQLSTTCSNFTEVAQWGDPSCSQPQPATDNGTLAILTTAPRQGKVLVQWNTGDTYVISVSYR